MKVDLKREAKRFLLSRDPVVVLTLPGCGPVAINEAHWKYPSLRFPGAKDLLVSDEAAFLDRVASVTGRSTAGPSSALVSHWMRCYCGRVASILALRPQECVHELHHSRFVQYQGALDSIPGWEFNLKRDKSTRAKRVYQVIRVHSRFLAAVSAEGFKGADALLSVRFTPSEHFDLVVQGQEKAGALKASVVVEGLGRRPTVVIEPFDRAIEPDRLDPYRILSEHLSLAEARPAQAKEILQNAATLISGTQPNYPVEDIIASLYEYSGPRAPGEAEIRGRIADLRARLWDGPVVGVDVRAMLTRLAGDVEFQRDLVTWPVELQAEYASLSMPLRQLESLDIVLPRTA
ncbi:MAG: hypothetical protein JNK48_25125 [Bryobacterales bacterium]|nr:hypothetical protein [Bryobacterales bacterium]